MKYIEEAAKDLGLHLNMSKSEILGRKNSTKAAMLSTFPDLLSTDPGRQYSSAWLSNPPFYLLLSQFLLRKTGTCNPWGIDLSFCMSIKLSA